MNWKKHYTRIFLNELGESVSDDNINQHLILWWKNTRNKESNSLGLTDEGFEVAKQIDLKMYEICTPIEMKLTPQIIIFLDRLLDCPYYLDKRSVFVTNERKAVELTLFSGDLRKYGLAKAMSHTRSVADSS